MNKASAIPDIINLDRERLDKPIREKAYHLCDHTAQCRRYCLVKGECKNRGIVNWVWGQYAREN